MNDLKNNNATEIPVPTEQTDAPDHTALPENGRLDPCVRYGDEFYEQYVRDFQQNKKSRWFYRFIKRSFDIFASLLGIALLSPLMLLLAIAIKLDSRGPVLFKQQRVGRNGKLFHCYKFRTMKITAPHDTPTSQMPQDKDYVTRVGWFLRRFSLDELPQLFCCLVGTMSLIGPRPLVPSERKCHAMRESLGVYSMRPGVTGLAQVSGRDDVYYKNKAILDAEYVRDASLWVDVKILLRTVAVVLRRKGNHTGKRVTKNAEEHKDAE